MHQCDFLLSTRLFFFVLATMDPLPSEDMLTLKRKALRNLYEGDDDAIDPVYQAKANVLNEAIQEIGMGKYQVLSIHAPFV